ncbi:methyl-accepting chemotaxis protein [Shewanella avicenniae]|uniref:Methyl-accepting chemotaxis protein n=1 Tax=Shewanella avicenniae TaxID=2814294 RepID=A0ABX7QS44_9GAMM|nr:methyl-accepting chemotaxis protein [Shewanella avicenniae]QSX33776.1 methyl-accepting chemotaxis protein [Shewanella avicenniae]
MLRRIKIGKRLFLGFSILVLLSVVVGLSAIYHMFEIKTNIDNLAERRLPAALLVGEMNRNLLLVRISTTNALDADSMAERLKYQQLIKSSSQAYEESSSQAEVFHKTTAGRAAFEQVLDAKAAYDLVLTQVLNQIAADDINGAKALQHAQLNPLAEKVTDALSALAQYQRDTGKKQSNLAFTSLSNAEMSIIISIVVASVLGVILAIFFTASLVQPMKLALNASHQIAAGELRNQFDDAEPDEMGEVIRAMAKMRTQLRTTIEEIHHSASKLMSTSNELHTITETSVQTIEKQNAELDMAVTAVTEMTVAIEEVARSAAATSANSTLVDASATQGQQQVESTVDAIQQLESELQQSKAYILSLSNQIANIGSVMEVIRGIAEQTNLLALNAAIEAARAGDTGRGFAVVADEVRALAHRTQESTKQIGDTIKAVEAETVRTVSSMEQSSLRATDTLQKAQQSGAAIEEITAAISNISVQNLTIANAAEEQAAVAREVDSNLVNIKHLSEFTSASARETRISSEKTAELAQHLSELVKVFKV